MNLKKEIVEKFLKQFSELTIEIFRENSLLQVLTNINYSVHVSTEFCKSKAGSVLIIITTFEWGNRFV